LQQTRKPIRALFDAVVRECRLPEKDRSLAMNLAYGVLRRRDCLTLLIGRVCRHPLHKLDPFVHHALEVGLFQIFYLDRIPESAAVNETVNAMKTTGLPQRLQGLVNGILRESIRQGQNLKEMLSRPATVTSYLNHPAWLTERWRRHFGEEEMQRICRCNNGDPLLVLRVNAARIAKESFHLHLNERGITSRDGDFASGAIVLPDYQGPIPLLPGYSEGHFSVQDEATQLASLLLGPWQPQGRYLDACAGLGGKTCHLVEMESALGLQVFAVEPDHHRFAKLEENLQRLFPGHRCAMRQCTLEEFSANSEGSFDGVLVDAPCSGTGVTGRHPDIRWNREENDLARYQQEQIALIEQAAGLVAAKGVLVYATCSLEPEENQEVVHQFLARHHEFHLSDPASFLPPTASRFIRDLFFNPHPDETIDGFFAARLIRQ
jgi:16S rRNA (cytosine967-C5)-methyltransferase